jgi:hypothetical protein
MPQFLEMLVQLVLQDPQVLTLPFQVQQDLKVILDPQDHKAMMEKSEQQVHKENLVPQELRETLDQ